MNDESLTLPSVVRRFRESEETLTRLGETLRNLGLSEQQSKDAANDLRTTSAAVTTSASAIDGVARELTALTSRLREAVEATSGIMEQADVNRLLAAIDGIAAAIGDRLEVTLRKAASDQDAATTALEERLERRLSGLTKELTGRLEEMATLEKKRGAEVEALRREAAEYRAALDQARGALPARALKKAGLA